MKLYIAVVGVVGGKVTKYADFDTQAEADAHVVAFGGYSADNPGGVLDYWSADSSAETLTYNSALAATEAATKDIKNEITRLQKAMTPRRMRERDTGDPDAVAWWAAQAVLIDTERAKL